MIDTKFLNEKATKFKTALKKIKQILDKGEEEFLSFPMYPDRAKYYAIIAYDELEQIACHLIKNITREKLKEKCLERLAEERIFSDKTSRIFEDFINFKNTIMNGNFSYSEKELYAVLKNIVDYLYENFIPELAKIVNELKKKEPKLAIPVNVSKLNKQASAIKSSLKKIELFLQHDLEEFKNTPLAIDRSKYFLLVALDSALWICRHTARAAKLPRSKNCFENLAKHQIISEETAKELEKLNSIREQLVDPTADIDLEFLYEILKKSPETFNNFITEISKSILEKKEQKSDKQK